MRSRLPKVLHPVAGKPMLLYAVEHVTPLTNRPPIVVVGDDAGDIRRRLAGAVEFVTQDPPLGTGHAVAQARPTLDGQVDHVLICYGDMPLLRQQTLRAMMDAHLATGAPLTILTAVSEDSMGFGRVVRDVDGRVLRIVEEKVATPEELSIRELNAGVYCCQSEWLWASLEKIQPSPVGEYYLTDLVQIAADEGLHVATCTVDDVDEVQGINTRVHLARAEAIMRRRINEQWMLAGVTIIDPATTYIEATVSIGQDTVIYPNTYLYGDTSVGEECEIGPNAYVVDSQIGNRCRVFASVIEGARMEDDCDIGPFGHLREGAHLAQGVHMGNFGEVKNSYLGPGTKMGHFSYVGDAHVGPGVNIGAGTVTCNYDGARKHRTEIGEGAFIGSGTMLVAPVSVGRNARIGAGAVVTRDVPDGALAYGVPARVREEGHEK